MALNASVQTPFGSQTAYWRIVTVTANNHGLPNSALARAYPSREYFYAANAVNALPDTLNEEEREEAMAAIEGEYGIAPDLPAGQNAFVAERDFEFEGSVEANGWEQAYEALATELHVENVEV
tara:strand:+ start:566 stop:934 length:369 start_codon:yes stop_codon:yes gene_type:complete